jgi:hypothetical protein
MVRVVVFARRDVLLSVLDMPKHVPPEDRPTCAYLRSEPL